jgi:hypothetical protein
MSIQINFGARNQLIHRDIRRRLAAGALAPLLALGLSANCATAAADGLDASPPAVIDADGYQTTDTSTFPVEPTWPGASSHPCCSR